MKQNVYAAILIIGNEILSGRTQDVNINFIAKELVKLGIRLKQVVIIQDVHAEIIMHVNQLRANYDYVFTTGGIGPTHDDITTECIAKAFGQELALNKDAFAVMEIYYKQLNASKERFETSLKMAHLPINARLIDNPISAAPGYIVENVYVMAGIPNIMQAMFNNIKQQLIGGSVVKSLNLSAYIGESVIAKQLTNLQNKYNSVEIGSYPFKKNEKWGTSLVLSSIDNEMLKLALQEIKELVQSYNAEIIEEKG